MSGKKIKLTFEQFREKYEGKHLFMPEYGGDDEGGVMEFSNTESELYIYGNRYEKVILIFTPSRAGWKDLNQRNLFYQDAKRAGVKKMAGKKNVWYRTVGYINK